MKSMRMMTIPMKSRRLRSDVYSENGDEKRCGGKTHKNGPVMLPLVKFHTHKSGPNKGKPFSECIECWRARRGYAPDGGWVSRDEWMPVVARLVNIAGSKAELCRATGKHIGFFSRKRDRMSRRVLRELEQLLSELEALDTNYQGRSEPDIYDPEPFATVLNKFIDDWNEERPQDSSYEFQGVVEWLHEQTGIHPRRILAFRKREIERVPATQVDALVQAMNLTHFLFDGTLVSKPNPLWSMESYLDHMRRSGCV